MTTIDRSPTPTWAPRQELDLIQEQLRAIAHWNDARRVAEQGEHAAAATARSREMRLDLSRRMDVVRRQHQALVARTEQHMRESAHLLSSSMVPRAVVVHRNAWFVDKVSAGLEAGGVRVVARLDNGADAVGVAIAEQPDLLLVEDKLPMVNGDEVLRQLAEYAPATVGAAQVSSEDGIARLLDAGARTAFTRRVPPADVASDLCALVAQR